MFRWFFVLSGVFVFMCVLAFFLPSLVYTPAFQVQGVPVYWGLLETALMIYIGHRATK